MKMCNKCEKLKDESEFYKDKSRKDGLYPSCKDCSRQQNKEDYQKNKVKILPKAKKYYQEHREEKIQYGKKYYREHKKEKNQYDKARRKQVAEYERKMYRTNISYKITANLRCRLNSILQGKNKSAHTLELLGLDIYSCRNANPLGALLQYLEYQFKEGMTWDNQGEWEIDHIVPMSYAGESLKEEFWQKYLFNYKNLQPMWKSENRSKYNKIKFVNNKLEA